MCADEVNRPERQSLINVQELKTSRLADDGLTLIPLSLPADTGEEPGAGMRTWDFSLFLTLQEENGVKKRSIMQPVAAPVFVLCLQLSQRKSGNFQKELR